MPSPVWLIAYDVANTRQRTRLYKLLQSFGEAVQRSVFLCPLDARHKAKLETLLRHHPLAPGDRLDWFQVHATASFATESVTMAITLPETIVVE